MRFPFPPPTRAVAVAFGLLLPHHVAAAETATERVVRDIRALAVHDAERGRPRTALVVDIERGNAARLRPGEVARLYTDAYDRARERLDDPGVWADIRSKLPWVAAVVAILAAVFRDTLVRWINGLVALGERLLVRRLASSRLLRRRVLARYARWLLTSTRRVALPFREDQHLDIDDVVVPLQVVSTDGSQEVVAEQALWDHRRVVLTGEPGAGKSMTVRHLARTAARRLADRDAVPVPALLELRELGTAPVVDRIVETLASGGFPNAGAFVDRALRDGGVLVLLDGLDEVASSEREGAVERIREFLLAYEGCRVVVTCRRAVYRGELDDLIDRRFALNALDDQQVQAFLSRWERFMPAGKSSRQLLQSLRDHPRLMGSARNPLLLTMIAHLYTHVQDYVLPHSRADFYEGAVRLLLSEWRARVPNRFQQPEKRKALRELALRSQAAPAADGDLATFALEDALEELRAVLPTVGRDPAEARTMLDEIVERSGLLVALDGGERYRFTHQTFQEFLAADKLRENAHDLLARFEEDRDAWREVVKLWCGLADDCTTVLQRVEALEPISALECLADAANVDPDVASTLIAPLRDELQSGTGTPAMERAFGAVASDPRPRGRAVFADLADRFAHARDPAAVTALGRALSYTNLPAAAELLAARCEREPAVRESLIRMGDLAVPVLSDLLQEDSADWPVDALLRIATPDAALALLPALDGSLAEPAAWVLAALLTHDVVRARLCLETEQGRLGMRVPLGVTWMWEPFAAVEPGEAPLGSIVARIVPLLQTSTPPPAVTRVEPRVATACIVLAGGLSSAVDRDTVADQALLTTVAHLHLSRRPRRRSLLGSTARPVKLATLVETLHLGYDGTPGTRQDTLNAIELIVDAATHDSERWLVCLRSLPAASAWRIVLGSWSGRPVTRATWSMVTQRPERFEQSRTYAWLLRAVAVASLLAAGLVGLHFALDGWDLLGWLALFAIVGGWIWMFAHDVRADADVLMVALLSPFASLFLIGAGLAEGDARDTLVLAPAIGFAPAVVGTVTVALSSVLPLELIVVGWLLAGGCCFAAWTAARRREAAGHSFVAGMFAPTPEVG